MKCDNKQIKLITLILIVLSIYYSCDRSSSEELKSYNYPNPFQAEKESTTIVVVFQNNISLASISIKCSVLTDENNEVWNYEGTFSNLQNDENQFNIIWNGKNNDGETVKPDVYEAIVKVSGISFSINSNQGGGNWSTQFSIVVQ